MIEEEARTKWCPYAFIGLAERAEFRDWNGGCCIASDCMAWKWAVTKDVTVKVFDPDGETLKDFTQTDYPEYGGYCGLAK